MNRKPGQLTDRTTFKQLLAQKLPLSPTEASAILEKHRLGTLKSLTPLQANFTNTVFELALEQSDSIILKINFRPSGGALAADATLTRLLAEKTNLPVSDFALLDTQKDVLPHPYLLTKKLPGKSARTAFETGSDEYRAWLSGELGRIVGTIHNQEAPDGLNPPRSFNRWREAVENQLLDNPDYVREIAAVSPDFYPRLKDLLAAVTLPQLDEQSVLLWCDPVFHNLLVDPRPGRRKITGVYDFQTARAGDPLFDFFYVEGDFTHRNPPDVYRNPAHLQAFYSGYKETGRTVNPPTDTHRLLREIILKSGGSRWWWNAAKILHPKTRETLQDVLDGLTQLSEK